MSNNTVPAVATGLPTRRAALAGLAAAPFAAPALAAEPSPLQGLIEVHRAAWKAFDDSVGAVDAAREVYNAAPWKFFSMLNAVEREHDRLNDVEEAAALAVASFPCRTMAEARQKARYMTSASAFCDMVRQDFYDALINSFLTAEA